MIDRNALFPIARLTPTRLAVAVIGPVIATLVTVMMRPVFEQSIFMLFMVAVLTSALYGGLWAGLVATGLCVLGIASVVFEPVPSLAIESPADFGRAVAFAVFSVVIALLAQLLIAARQRAETQAREARIGEESFRQLFDSTADAIYVLGPTGRMVNLNDAAAQIHGYPREELKGKSWEVLAHPGLNDLGLLRGHVESAFAGETVSIEAWARHSSGRAVPLEVKITAARYFDRDVVLAVARDLSERRRLEEQLRQSQKMDAIGRLAGGVAHDFNNLLTSIRGYASLMRDRVAHDPTLIEDLREIERAVELATAVTGQLLAFSRKQEYLPRAISLNESLERMEALLRRLIGERVELAVERAPDLGRAMLDEGQFEQVVMNLVVNARDAVGAGDGRIGIRTFNVPARAAAGPMVGLEVSDDGVGMDEDTRARIFEPFFTTKATGHGTGLGLSTVYGIVKQSGGHVEVETAPGRGATFVVTFPRIDRPMVAVAAEASHGPGITPIPASHGPEPDAPVDWTVLLAEDETPVRHLVKRVLGRRGYRVLEAANGREALEVARAHPGRIDALVTDVVMPELTGPELAERLRADQPDLPVLFTSGYNEDGMEGTGVVSGLGIAFLQKPFEPEELLRLLAELLEPVDTVDRRP